VNTLRKETLVRVLGSGLFTAALVLAQNGAVQPDSTKSRKREGGNSVTHSQQEMNEADQHLRQSIRDAVKADKSLSSDGHKVTVISQSGRVTLKGHVRSLDEKQKIVAKAIELAGGDGNVDDELSVKPAATK
jgi:osmotically-inducible protein OsmY